jgi:PRC-barrel domain
MATDTVIRTKKHTLIASDRVEGTAVRRPKGDKIGSIERLMIDKVSGKVAYAVLSFGGFLGIGHKHLPIPWSLLKYHTELDAYELDIADEVLRKAPSSDQSSEFDFGDRLDEAKLYSYYNVPPYWGF